MQYKFEFMQEDYVPKEHLAWDLERRKRDCLTEIVKMISKDYGYKTRTTPDGKEVYCIELMVCSTKKFSEAMNRFSAAYALFPEFKHIAQGIIEEMFYPDEEEITQPEK